MSKLKEFDPTYKLDKKIKRDIEKGTFVPTTKTENGIRGQYLKQRPDMKIRYEMAIEKRRRIIKGIAIGSGITLVTLGGLAYKQVSSPKQSINVTTTDNFFEKEMDIINKSEAERKTQRDEIVEDLSQMSASGLQNYTKQVIVDVYNKKNPDNQIQIENFSYGRSTETLAANKDKLGNTVSYSIWEMGNFEENRDLEFQKGILKFYLDGEIIAMMKEDGSPIKVDGNYNYDFSEFASLLNKERYLVDQLNSKQFGLEDNKDLMKQEQESYASTVQKLKQENVIEQAENTK